MVVSSDAATLEYRSPEADCISGGRFHPRHSPPLRGSSRMTKAIESGETITAIVYLFRTFPATIKMNVILATTAVADEYIIIQPPETVTVATLRPEATSLQQLSVAKRTLYPQLQTLHNNDLSQYQYQ
jgi:hypothetical protein